MTDNSFSHSDGREKGLDDSENSAPSANIYPRRPSMLCAPESLEYTTYTCYKTKGGVGRCFHFQFDLDDKHLFHTKLKSLSQTTPIPINKGDEVHYSKASDYYMVTNTPHETFVLREGDPSSDEDLFIMTTYQIASVKEPKMIKVEYKTKDGSFKHVINRKPVIIDGQWILDFAERYIIPSKKNAILVVDKDKEWIVVRKTEDNEMELDALNEIDPIYVFAVALAIWLTPI